VLNLRLPPGRALLALGALALLASLAFWLHSRGEREPAPETAPETAPFDAEPTTSGLLESERDTLRREPLAGVPAASDAPRATAAAESGAAPQSGTARIVGRVFDSTGAPLSAAYVLAAAPEGDLFAPSFTATSDLEGWYELRDLAPGSYDLGVRPAGVALGSTVLQRIEVEAGAVAVADLALKGARTLRGGFEFADTWDDMDMSLVRVVLWRKGEWGSAVARAYCFTSHAELWRSGAFRFEGLEPGVYVLEAWPFVEEEDVWRGEVDLSERDAGLPCRALGADHVWRERAAVEPPRTAWNGPTRD